MSTDPIRHALNGETMGTRWAALFHAAPGDDPAPVQASLQAAVDEVDAQMSTWKPDSDLMRFNAVPVGDWAALPEALLTVLAAGVEIGRRSGGAFDLGMGDAVKAWGFCGATADPDRIRAALTTPRHRAHEALELDLANRRARKHAPLALDLSGIAKGYGVDRLAEVLPGFGIDDALVSIDGELRALGLRPDGTPWTVAVERPDDEVRAAQSILALENAAVATSGDYRHWVDVGGQRLSHTMDPRRGGPLTGSPASVTVVAETCMEADGWATALMVLGESDGAALARKLGLDALFLMRDDSGLRELPIGRLFGAEDAAGNSPTRLAALL